MKKLICHHFHRYFPQAFILVCLIILVSYLILVNTTGRKLEVMYRSLNSIDNTKYENNYELHKGIVENINESSQFIKRNTQEVDLKVILIWSHLFEIWDFLQLGRNTFKNSGCLESRCEITSDRKRLLQSDAILFHVRTLSMLDIPKNRTPKQKWVFLSLEAPPYSRFQGFEFMVNMFNWTMTYRKDSDIFIPYGRIVYTNNKFYNYSDLHKKWKNKTKMAVGMVSHCSTDGNREEYIDQLRFFIDVDTYGTCGLGTCPFNKTNLCIKNFSKQYLFFLAFENAICEDYITEKLFRTLQYDMIPVVYGGGDYTAAAPRDSFIDALNFPSPKHLASHLHKIASNFTLFSSYFKWRIHGYSEDTPNHCELCHKLHSDEFKKHSVYFDINEWWIKKSHCKAWRSDNYSN